MVMNLYSVDLERHLLGGLINCPSSIAQIDGFLKESDFKTSEHAVIYSCIRQLLQEKQDLTVPILVNKVQNLGIKFRGDLEIGEYIDALSFKKLNENGIIETAKEILKLRVLRDVDNAADDVKKYLAQNKDENISKIVSDVDAIHGRVIDNFSIEDGPVNLMEGLEEEIIEIGNNPIEGVGLKTPFDDFNRLNGELRGGNIYAIASRPGQGKTTFLNRIGHGVSRLNNVPVLFLDTEMSTKEIKFRNASAMSGVPLWYVETGNWNRNSEMRARMKASFAQMKNVPVFHQHVGNKTIDEVASIIRRWYWTHVGRGNKCLICYDYLKLTGEKLSNNWAEYQAIGEKTDKLKKISEEIDCPIFTAVQINRSGEKGSKGDPTDDSSVIAQSDRLMWFCTFLAIFRQKTMNERQEDGPNFGTHKMIRLKGRYQGKDASGHNDVVERLMEDGSTEYQSNYINYLVENFEVSEKGTLEDIVSEKSLVAELPAPKDDDDQPVFE